MLFTIRPLSVSTKSSQNPIEDFTKWTPYIKGSLKREAYFIRYIGKPNHEENYIDFLNRFNKNVMESHHTGGFMQIGEFEKIRDNEEVRRLLELYERWQQTSLEGQEEVFKLDFPMAFMDDVLEWTQKCAFCNILKRYKEQNPNISESMIRNFAVKLLGWISYYLPKIYRDIQKRAVWPKFIYAGAIGKHELCFLYFLYLMGCDVIYMHPSQDIAYEMHKSCSRLFDAGNHENAEVPDREIVRTKLADRTGIHLENQTSSKQESRGKIDLTRKSPKTHEAKEKVTAVPKTAKCAVVSQPMKVGNIVLQPGNAPNRANTVPIPKRQEKHKDEENKQPISKAESKKNETGVKIMTMPQETPGYIAHPILEEGHQRGAGKEKTYEELARLSTSVVKINVYNEKNELAGCGSGVVINNSGYILTNYHVTRIGRWFGILFENEKAEYKTDRIVKYHKDYDLAIIKVEKICQAIPIYTGDDLVRGQKVVAIGSPLGLFNTISDGIISGFRNIKGRYMIQFTAPISHGSSGGALLDMYGNLIGISTGGFDDGENLGLAVDTQSIRYFCYNYID